MTETQATKPEAPPRLAFRWWKSFSDSFIAEVAVTERMSARRSVATTYAFREAAPIGAVRVFHCFKQGEPVPYVVRVSPGGHTCSCRGATYRHQNIDCRHYAALIFLWTEGVIS